MKYGRLVVWSWGTGGVAALAWLPWALAAGRSATTGGWPIPLWSLAATGITIALCGLAGARVGSRSRWGRIEGALAGGLAGGLAWALVIGPVLAVVSQAAIWSVGDAPRSTDLMQTVTVDSFTRTLFAVVGSAWVSMGGGALAGAVGATLRGSASPVVDAPPLIWPIALSLRLFLWVVFGVAAIGSAFPGIEEARTRLGLELIVQPERFLLLDYTLLSGLIAALVAASTTVMLRVPSAMWRLCGVLHLLALGLCLLTPWWLPGIRSPLADRGEWTLWVVALLGCAAVGAFAGRHLPRPRIPTWRDLVGEWALLATGTAILGMGPALATVGFGLLPGLAVALEPLEFGGPLPAPGPAFAVAFRYQFTMIGMGFALAAVEVAAFALPMTWALRRWPPPSTPE